jgi:hypothetical protein
MMDKVRLVFPLIGDRLSREPVLQIFVSSRQSRGATLLVLFLKYMTKTSV